MRNSSKYFNSKLLKKGLGQKTYKGGILTIVSQGGIFILQFVTTVVLSRILNPDDFGLIGMVSVIVTFVSLFKDFGLSKATIQRPEITSQQISNLFWFNFGLCLLLGTLIVSGASAVAQFYERRELASVAKLFGIIFVMQGLGLQHRALMARQMKFLALAIISIAAMFIGCSISIYMAWAGYRYWALVALAGLPPIVDGLLCIIYTRWVPELPRLNVGTLPFLKYGSNLMGFNLVNFFTRNLDNILIGKYLGASILGYYNMSYRMLLLPMQQINGPLSRPMLVALSSLQFEPVRYRLAYSKSLKMVSTATIPIVFFLAGDPSLIITTILGSEWGDAAPIFLALAPYAFVSSTNFATGWVYSSLGHTGRQFRVGIVTSFIMISAIIAGLQYGAIGVALAASIVSIIMRVPIIYICFYKTPLKLIDFFKSIARPTLSSLFSLLLAKLIMYVVVIGFELYNFIELALFALIYWAIYGSTLLIDRSSEGFFKTVLTYSRNR